MYKKFIKALAWNSAATFFYKIALLSHQIMLYYIISNTLYGVQSSLFASIYIIIAVTNFGFDETLLPFFSTFSKSKQQFLQAWYHFMIRIITVTLMAIALYNFTLYGSGEFLHKLRSYCNKNLILIVSSIFWVESIKKSLIAMMQLAFLTEQIAYTEIAMLTIYIGTIWLNYAIYNELTLFTIFMPMLIASTLELTYLASVFFGFYCKLPTAKDFPANIPFKVIFLQRLYNYINQIAKTIYSPNSMTVAFAYLLGFQQAATIKIFTNIITLSYTCLSKTIGVTSGAAFSAMNKMPLSEIKFVFHQVTRKYLQFLLLLSITLGIILGYSWYMSIVTSMIALQVLLFFIVNFLEHVGITYEQLFMSQHASSTLARINIVIVALCGYIYYLEKINQLHIIIVLIGVKLLSLSMVKHKAKIDWGI